MSEGKCPLDPQIAHLRRLYHHIINGGVVSALDLSTVIAPLERNRDLIQAGFMHLSSEIIRLEAKCADESEFTDRLKDRIVEKNNEKKTPDHSKLN